MWRDLLQETRDGRRLFELFDRAAAVMDAAMAAEAAEAKANARLADVTKQIEDASRVLNAAKSEHTAAIETMRVAHDEARRQYDAEAARWQSNLDDLRAGFESAKSKIDAQREQELAANREQVSKATKLLSLLREHKILTSCGHWDPERLHWCQSHGWYECQACRAEVG